MVANWLGPAVIAAVIAAFVSAAGWYVSYRTTVGLERHRRSEKVRDLQVALRAETRSELHDLRSHDLQTLLADISERYASDPAFSVKVPTPARHVVFEKLIGDIYLLPESVIDGVVLYNRQRDIIEKFVADMRSPDFSVLGRDRQLAMYADYLRLRTHLRDLAEGAVGLLDASLNSRGADRSDLRSGGGGQDSRASDPSSFNSSSRSS